MKLIVRKNSLEVCVKNLARVIDKQNILPILADILFDVNEQEKTATLTASDSEITMKYTVVLDECEGGGKFCVNADTLAAMLAEVSEQPLTITATTESDMRFTLTYQDGSAFCPIEPCDEYPIQPNTNESMILTTVDADLLKRTIKRSLWAASDNELRQILNGIYVKFDGDNCDVVASDGHVMMRNAEKTGCTIVNGGSFIMPKKVAKILPGMLDEDDVYLSFNERVCTIEQDTMALSFRCIDGTYPKYETVIPAEFAHEVRCNRINLLSALRAVSPFTPESSNLVVLTFQGNTLDVNGDNLDFGSGAKKTVNIDGYQGEPMTIGMKAINVINLLSKLAGADVTLKFNARDRAVVIEPVENIEGEHITGMTMPMITNG